MATEVKPPATQDQAAPPAAPADTTKKVTRPLTIGRIVIYQVSQDDSAIVKENNPTHLPAIVVRANNDKNANLKVFCDGRIDEWIGNVSMGDEPGQWQWPDMAQPLSDEATKNAA